MATKSLTPVELNYYSTQANRFRRNFDYGNEQNRYDRNLAQQGYSWDTQDLTRQFTDARNKFSNPYNQRGMMHSGGYGHDLGRFYADQARGFGRLDRSNNLKMHGFDMAQSQLQRIKSSSLAELEGQKAAYRKTIAATLAGQF